MAQDKTKYNFNDKTNLGKRKLAKEVIEKYLQDNLHKNYEELIKIFDFTASNRNPVILNDEKYKEWSDKRGDAGERYFDPIKYDTYNIYICKQWSINSIPSLIEFAKKQNYNIVVQDENNTTKLNIGTGINIKNIILYGSPGVGKTHNYQNIISMIESGKQKKYIFDTITENKKISLNDKTFKKIKDENRVKFITFHQNYSYEDFIEGFRPKDKGHIELKDGIFKNIVNEAKENLENSKKNLTDIQKNLVIKTQFENYISHKINNQQPLELQQGGEFELMKLENNNLFFTTSKKSNIYTEFKLSYDDFEKINNSSSSKEILKDISQILGTKSVQQKYAYYLQIYKDFDKNKQEIAIPNIGEISNKLKNFYLIIDEINRGNISKIFGELITLIEEDKRDYYEITLPYSKETFSIPSNLYIIGTMNSTDKSIATIDIALRRRFTFLKMLPNLELVENEEARELMKKLNTYIESKLGEDYMLGHSYFMKVKTDDDLEFVKQYKIKPLLEEYFYADDKTPDDIINEALGQNNEQD